MIRRIATLSAAGDLTFRCFFSALASLYAAGRLPSDFRILALARSKWESEAYRRATAARLASHAERVDPAVRRALVEMIDYRRASAARLLRPTAFSVVSEVAGATLPSAGRGHT